ncbi:MAG: hypothetical protein IPM48_00855 [Saprospiraceae bacterium]|nr:hypothetical protein [Saprospiraceae bacterium]
MRMQEAELNILGIRHHGAGSCRRMMMALEQIKPDALCIELPKEVEQILHQLSESGNECPLAFLLYEEAQANNCYYLPFAEFSPEYQAILFGLKHHIPVFAMDLPAKYALANRSFGTNDSKNLTLEQKNMIRDPLGYLASMQGYKDSEIWWSKYFEHWTEHSGLFDMIQQLMCELRHKSNHLDDAETLIREKFMRDQIRKCLAQGYKKIAVICGAWHGPVLTMDHIHQSSHEKPPTLKSVNTSCTLIPWSYQRLVLNREYSAGVKSPAWNESLFLHPDSALSDWLTKAAWEFRKFGYSIGTSEIIDAEKLAYQLTLLRGLSKPGIQELEETLICIFGQADPGKIQLLSEKIFVGSKIGKLHTDQSKLPFVKEFKSQIKSLGLLGYWEQENEKTLQLDLRKPKHLEKSRFIHKCFLLELNWAIPVSLDFVAQGNFHEHWNFAWSPELEVDLIHKAILGNSMDELASRLLVDFIQSKDVSLAKLGMLMEHALKAGMDQLITGISQKIHALCIDIEDVMELSKLLRPLLAGLSYGSLHNYHVENTRQLIEFILPRLVFNFGHQCIGIQDEKARSLMQTMLTIHSSFYHCQMEELKAEWKEQVKKFSAQISVHPIIRGKGINLCLDEQWISDQEYGDRLIMECGDAHSPNNTALWLEGFLLSGSAFYLNKDEMIFTLDNWLRQLSDEQFKTVLPLLRRSFSQISYGELIRIKSKINQGNKNLQSLHLYQWVWREDLIKKTIEKLKPQSLA